MPSLLDAIKEKDVDKIQQIMKENNLVLDGDRIVARDKEAHESLKKQSVFWGQRQLAKKILLNALYGALLQSSCKFYDERIGQSTTLSGRSVVKHMNSKVNEAITGIYNHVGDAIDYADTDSCYFSAYEILKDDPSYADFEWSKENIIELYDAIAEEVNDSFPAFMVDTFNTSPERGRLIAAGRELIASKALFVKKKKYAALIYDLDGFRTDMDEDGNPVPGKLKVMGLDLKRADTPKFMQVFLQSLLMDVLQDADQQKMYEDIKSFRTVFVSRPGWEKGSPKKISNLTKYLNQVDHAGKVDVFSKGGKFRVNMPGHARASINWNRLCEINNDKYSVRITDGARIIVCKLKPNLMKMDSVAYPIDEPHIPQWFKDLPFDHEAMEDTIIDSKIMNLVGVLNWDLSNTKTTPGAEFFSFGEIETPVEKEKDERIGHNGGPVWDEDDEDDD